MKKKIGFIVLPCFAVVMLLISVSFATGYTPATFRVLFNLTYTVPTQINVTLDANGGVFSDSSITKSTYLKYGGLSELEEPSRAGYSFAGWTDEEETQVYNPDKFPFTDGCTLYAKWTPAQYTITFDAEGGTGAPLYKGVNYGTTYTDLPIPTKEGYTFGGWYAEFDGTDNAWLPYGRAYMFTDKLSVHVTAYMDNWANFSTSTNDLRLISCTESGGWSFYSSGGKIALDCYDSGYGYRNPISAISWSSLSTGWHDFDLIFDGINAKLYLDDTLIATGDNFTSGRIGYNATNGIFVGAEAKLTATTPDSHYGIFNGYIGNISIQNNTTRLGSTGALNTYTCANANVTLHARWMPSYTVTFDPNGGSMPVGSEWNGSGESATKEVAHGLTYGMLPTPTREGYRFDGWSVLPNEYQEVEYIQSSGAGAYIDTGVLPNGKLMSQLKITSNSEANIHFGARSSSGDPLLCENINYRLFTAFSNGSTSVLMGDMGYGIVGAVADNHRIQVDTRIEASTTYEFEYGNRYIKNLVTNSILAENTPLNVNEFGYTSEYTIRIFGFNTQDYVQGMKLWYCKMYDGDTLVRDLIPCYRISDDKVGLYDTVNSVFYTNQGTGSLTAGNNVTRFVRDSSIVNTASNHTLTALWAGGTLTIYKGQGNLINSSSMATSYNKNGNNASITYSPINGGEFILTPTSSVDPFVHTNAYAYLTAGRTYRCHATVYESDGSLYTGSWQMGWFLNSDYPYWHQTYIGNNLDRTFTPTVSGNYYVRFDREDGEIRPLTFRDVWIAEDNANNYVTITRRGGTTYNLGSMSRSGQTFSNWILDGMGSIDGNIYTFGDGDAVVVAHYTINGITPLSANGGYSNQSETAYTFGTIANFINERCVVTSYDDSKSLTKRKYNTIGA